MSKPLLAATLLTTALALTQREATRAEFTRLTQLCGANFALPQIRRQNSPIIPYVGATLITDFGIEPPT